MYEAVDGRVEFGSRRRTQHCVTLRPAVALLVVTQGSLIWFYLSRPANLAGFAVASSPVAAIAWLVWGQIRTIGRADEFQRVQQLQALSIGFAVVIVVRGQMAGSGDGDDASTEVPFASARFTVQ